MSDETIKVKKTINKLNARIFSIKSNVKFGNNYLTLNPDDDSNIEIQRLIKEQEDYQKKVTSLKESLESLSKSLETSKEDVVKLKAEQTKLANDAENLLNDKILNSVLIKLKNDLNKPSTINDFDVKMDDVYQECITINDSARRNGIILVVIGQRGAGKSSFINVFCGRSDFDEDSAKTNVVEETLEPQFYDSIAAEEYKNMIKLWDFPGLGTDNFPIEEYKKMAEHLPVDAYIYMYKGRFSEFDEEMLKYLSEKNHKVFVVRNLADQDLQTVLNANGIAVDLDALSNEDLNDGEYVKKYWPKVCEKYDEELAKINNYLGEATRVYYISCSRSKHFDCETLLEDIAKDMPKQKCSLILMAIQYRSIKFFNLKFDTIKETLIPLWSLQSASVYAKGNTGTNFFKSKVKEIQCMFGIHQEMEGTISYDDSESDDYRSNSGTILENLMGLALTNDSIDKNAIKKYKFVVDATYKALQGINALCFAKVAIDVAAIK